MFNDQYDASFVEIRRSVLEQNARTVVEAVEVPVIAVVKFDGYGMGIAEAARAWQKAGVKMFAVSESWEALALRQAGFTEDILLLAPVADEKTLTDLLEQGIILTVSDPQNAKFYQANRGSYTLRVHVKVDTGMGRFGVRWTDTEKLKEIYRMDGFSFEGIFSHFQQRQLVDGDGSGLTLHLFSLPGQVAELLTVYLQGGIHGRNLEDFTPEGL